MKLPLILILQVPLVVTNVVAATVNCSSYYEGIHDPDVAAARKWCNEGTYFDFHSPANSGQVVSLFTRCAGGGDSKPTIVMGHGWPTSSFDFQRMSALAEPHARVCTVDYVGAGFSEKPAAPWRYHIDDHAHAILEMVKFWGVETVAYLTHDEGSSVGFRVLELLAGGSAPGLTLTHHFVLDGSIYLPLAQLTEIQKVLLSNSTGPEAQKLVSPSLLASGMAERVYTPHLNRTEVKALESVFAFEQGTHILHETIQYLHDRSLHEIDWLVALHNSSVDCSLIWGTEDPVAVPAIADYVWENYLHQRPHANATYTKIAGANHYLTVSNAEEVWEIVRKALGVQIDF